MRWEDERFVKLYTRDTLTMKRLGWQGRAVLCELFRKVDRAGLLDIGDTEPAEALSVLLDMPEEIAGAGLKRLVATDTAVLLQGPSRSVFLPKFLEAQDANQSDKARQAKSREMARAKAELEALALGNVTPRDAPAPERDASRPSTERDAPATPRDAASQAVQECHDRSQPVTLEQTRLEQDLEGVVGSKPRRAREEQPPPPPFVPLPIGSPVTQPWPPGVLDALRAYRQVNEATEPAFAAFLVNAAKYPPERRAAAARKFIAQRKDGGWGLLLAMIRDGDGLPNGAATQPEQPWKQQGFESERQHLEAKYRAWNDLPIGSPLPDGWEQQIRGDLRKLTEQREQKARGQA
jgi:hypothetical protein